MCGFAGIAHFHQEPIPHSILGALEQKLRHRGPDDQGFLSYSPTFGLKTGPLLTLPCAPLAMVHRRLMIQDLSMQAAQPMLSEDGRYALVFNGEIYNFKRLKERLVRQGVHFNQQSDTQVLLKAFEKYRLDVFDHLEGMFSFAILDTQTQELILARDRFGIKPLYYHLNEKAFSFASEVNVLWAVPWIPQKACAQSLYEVLILNQCDSVDKSFYEEIKPVPPGHYMILNLKNHQLTSIKRYWHVDLNDTLDISYEEAQTQVRALFDESLGLHQQSLVPIGSALSGGIDSSLIASSLSHRLTEPLPTFSYIASDKAYSEAPWIDQMIAYSKLNSHKVYLKEESFRECFENVLQAQGQPFGSLSILAQYLVYQSARQHGVKVLLNGQGADEIFAGYYKYYLMRIKSLLYSKKIAQALELSIRAGLKHQLFKPQILLKMATTRQSNKLVTPKWIDITWFEKQNVQICPSIYKGPLSLRQSLYESLTHKGLISLLRYDDLNAMAHGVETRVPFLYTPLVEFVLKLPEHYLIPKNGVTKSILRDAFADRLPKAITQRKDKIGFEAREKQIQVSSKWLKTWHEKIRALPFVNSKLDIVNMPAEQLLFHNPLFRLLCISHYVNSCER